MFSMEIGRTEDRLQGFDDLRWKLIGLLQKVRDDRRRMTGNPSACARRKRASRKCWGPTAACRN